MIQLREANARSSVSLIAPAHPPCRAPGAPDASDANRSRSRSRSDRLFTHTPPKTRDLARKIFSPKKSHLYGKSLSWRSSRARRRASSRAHLSVRGVPVQANPALIVCASARARPRQSHRTRQRTTRRRDATINRTNRAIFRFFPAPSPRGAVVASFAFAFAFARAASASPISSSARVASFARARSFDRRTRPPIASTSADAPERRSRRSRRKESLASRPGMPSQP